MPELNDLLPRPRLPWVHDFILRIGMAGSVALITLVSLLLSIGFTVISLRWAGLPVNWDLLKVAVIVPLIVAPLASSFVVHSLFHVHELELAMRSMATYDTLTGLLTRAMFLVTCESSYHTAIRNLRPLSVIALDLDRFKHINDSFGHAAGDAVLRHFGTVLRQSSRKSDIAGRLGGEEFFILLPDTDLTSATHFSTKILDTVRQATVAHPPHLIRYSVSIGIAELDGDASGGFEQLMKHSDLALYHAKHAGRDRFEVFSRE